MITILDTYALLQISGDAKTDTEKWQLKISLIIKFIISLGGKNVYINFRYKERYDILYNS